MTRSASQRITPESKVLAGCLVTFSAGNRQVGSFQRIPALLMALNTKCRRGEVVHSMARFTLVTFTPVSEFSQVIVLVTITASFIIFYSNRLSRKMAGFATDFTMSAFQWKICTGMIKLTS